MKTWQLIVLRIYMTMLGRCAFFARVLRTVLVHKLVKNVGAGNSYHASSDFFSMDELAEPTKESLGK
jgi:subtilase family serine protease